MQKIIFIISAVLLFSAYEVRASGKPSGCSTYVNCPQNIQNGPDNCTHPDDKNKIMIKANRKNGQLEGDFWCAKESGDPHVQVKFKSDEYDGIFEEYDPKLKEWATKTHYKNGKREGLHTRKLSDGRKIIRFYKNDNEHGYEITVDSQNKILQFDSCEVENMRKPDEDCAQIYVPGYEAQMKAMQEAKSAAKKSDDNKTVEKKFKNGSVAERYKLVDGQREGKHEEFFDNGKPSRTREYKAGKIFDDKIYFDDGQLKSHSVLDGRLKTQEKIYYQNGKMKSDYKFSSPEKWVTKIVFKEYHDNGQLAEEGTNLAAAASWNSLGTPDGEVKGYSREGVLIYKANYKDRKLEGPQTQITEDKIYNTIYTKGVLTEETVLEAKTNKQLSHKTFFPDGSVKSENKN